MRLVDAENVENLWLAIAAPQKRYAPPLDWSCMWLANAGKGEILLTDGGGVAYLLRERESRVPNLWADSYLVSFQT